MPSSLKWKVAENLSVETLSVFTETDIVECRQAAPAAMPHGMVRLCCRFAAPSVRRRKAGACGPTDNVWGLHGAILHMRQMLPNQQPLFHSFCAAQFEKCFSGLIFSVTACS